MIQIIKSETINGTTVEAITNGETVSVNVVRDGRLIQVSDWTDPESAAFVFSFTLSAIKENLRLFHFTF